MIEGKIVLVTGSNRGLGHELSIQLAKQGAVVLLACRNAKEGLKVQKVIRKTGGKAFFLPLDVTKSEDASEVALWIKEKYKKLDILINNAGVFSHQNDGKFEEITDDFLDLIVQTNQIGLVRLTRELLPLLHLSTAGRIINITSDLSDYHKMDGLFTVYRMTKAALNAMTVNLGVELQNSAIRVYGIDPGWMSTDMGGPDAPQAPIDVATWIIWVLNIKRNIPSGTILFGRNRASWWEMGDKHTVDQMLLFEQIESEYGLTPKKHLQSLGEWGTSYRWVIETENEKKIFLKERPYYQSLEDASFHRELNYYVFKNGGPVPSIYCTKNGAYSFVTESGREFELQEWQTGTNLSKDNFDDLENLGRVIARFGETAKEFNLNRGNWNVPNSRFIYHPDRLNNIQRHSIPFLRRGFEKLNLEEGDWINQILHYVEKAECNIPWGILNQQFLHGDAHVNNCVRLTDGHILMVDLDDARWGYRITDLAWACSVSAGIGWDIESSRACIATELDINKIHCIIHGYEEIVSLEETERLSLPYLLTINLVLSFINCTGLDEDDVEPAGNFIKQIRTLIQHLDTCLNLRFDERKEFSI